eukprot:GILJ01004108.1.p1 GENE.GILJ01004108.1~~GILJ01004108.1.p1  ORF type:complete len:530 (+),score=68.00 GILJ01004108.1:54-1592(+)
MATSKGVFHASHACLFLLLLSLPIAFTLLKFVERSIVYGSVGLAIILFCSVGIWKSWTSKLRLHYNEREHQQFLRQLELEHKKKKKQKLKIKANKIIRHEPDARVELSEPEEEDSESRLLLTSLVRHGSGEKASSSAQLVVQRSVAASEKHSVRLAKAGTNIIEATKGESSHRKQTPAGEERESHASQQDWKEVQSKRKEVKPASVSTDSSSSKSITGSTSPQPSQKVLIPTTKQAQTSTTAPTFYSKYTASTSYLNKPMASTAVSTAASAASAAAKLLNKKANEQRVRNLGPRPAVTQGRPASAIQTAPQRPVTMPVTTSSQTIKAPVQPPVFDRTVGWQNLSLSSVDSASTVSSLSSYAPAPVWQPPLTNTPTASQFSAAQPLYASKPIDTWSPPLPRKSDNMTNSSSLSWPSSPTLHGHTGQGLTWSTLSSFSIDLPSFSGESSPLYDLHDTSAALVSDVKKNVTFPPPGFAPTAGTATARPTSHFFDEHASRRVAARAASGSDPTQWS